MSLAEWGGIICVDMRLNTGSIWFSRTGMFEGSVLRMKTGDSGVKVCPRNVGASGVLEEEDIYERKVVDGLNRMRKAEVLKHGVVVLVTGHFSSA